MQLKDEVLDRLAASGANIAQFASFDPQGRQRYARIRGVDPRYLFSSLEGVISAIHGTQLAKNVNIRTFLPERPDGNPFLYGPRCGFHDPKTAAEKARELLGSGYYAIINETVDEADGGFSGVLYGDVFEFASRDIPRCVEKAGCAALPRSLAFDLIRTVYGFNFKAPYTPEYRIECSVHPVAAGYLGEQQIIWQAEKLEGAELPLAPRPHWPNRYSRDIGDKAYGLLIAHLLGFPVPYTHVYTCVFGRITPFFSFGAKTGATADVWLRTCPLEQQPGLFTTSRGWLDPAALLQREDPEGKKVSSVIVQQGVRAEYSGAAVTDAGGSLILEGKAGYGDAFMLGEKPEELPVRVKSAVGFLWKALRDKLGDVRFEWVYDGREAWIVQLHVGRSESAGAVIYPGTPASFHEFNVREGLGKLRELIEGAKAEKTGIVLVGDVGITSHFGDLLRRNKIPSRIDRGGER